eukprot:jgi/Tetstr1/428760/TSEL_018748.t1
MAAGFLVPRLRIATALRKQRRQYIQYLTSSRAMGRFLTARLVRSGRFFDAAGRPSYLPEYERIMVKGAEDTAAVGLGG